MNTSGWLNDHGQSFWLDASSQALVEQRLRLWRQVGFSRRLWDRDPTLWSATPVPELTDRLGWLTLPKTMREHLDDLEAFARGVRMAGTRHVVLLGMGGSSLAPEVFRFTFGHAPGHPALIVLDSTHPAAVRAVESRIDPRHTLFLVSSKSGTTTETLSLFRYFWHRTGLLLAKPGDHFAAITDADTPLVRLARERAFRRTFIAPPDVGGRYSALTVFGLVPAALIGVDVRRVLDRAQSMARACGSAVEAPDNPGLVLGAALGELASAGRDKVTLFTSAALSSLPSWIEQLIAESTGKDGKGIVPVVDESPAAAMDVYGGDRVFVLISLASGEADHLDGTASALQAAGHPTVRIRLSDTADIGQEYFRWEVAVAAAGAVLGIHPFNQPDVQLAKELAQQAMDHEGGQGGERGPEGSAEVSGLRPQALHEALGSWQAQARQGDYLGIQAYLAPSEPTTAVLQEIRSGLGHRLRIATTLGYGPRFLHSTGQLHKGGPNTGLFLQLVDDPDDDLSVPETSYSFGQLITAQALGDQQALLQRRRRLVRVHVGRNVAAGLAGLMEAVRAS